MQIVVRVITVFIGIYLAMLAFLPAKEGYFALEKRLADEHIYMNEAHVSERFGGLDLERTALFVDGVKVADADYVRARTAIFFSRLSAVGLKVDKSIADMIPVRRIGKIVVTHQILRPKQFRIVVSTDKGVFEANATIGERRLRFYAQGGEKEIQPLKSSLKRDKRGWYYEVTF